MHYQLAKVLFIGFLGFNAGLAQGAGISDFAFKQFLAMAPKNFDLFDKFPVGRARVIGLYKKSGTEDRNKALTVPSDTWVHASNEEEASKQKIHLYAILAGKEVDTVLPVSVVVHVVMDFLLNSTDFCAPELLITKDKDYSHAEYFRKRGSGCLVGDWLP